MLYKFYTLSRLLLKSALYASPLCSNLFVCGSDEEIIIIIYRTRIIG